MKKEKRLKLKAILYFIIGLNLGYIGLALAGLWIKFKTKINKRTKFKALIIGFGIFLLFHYVVSPYVLAPRAEKSLFSKYPETQTIKKTIEDQYPGGKVKVGVRWEKSLTTQGQPTTSLLIVQYDSMKKLTQGDMRNMGKLACNVLQSAGKNYDKVSIKNVFSHLPISIGLNVSVAKTAICDYFLLKAPGQKINTINVGTEATLSTLKIKVNSVREAQTITPLGSVDSGAKKGAKFVIINIDSMNITNASFAFPNDIILVDGKGSLYRLFPINYNPADSIVYRNMRPGIPETGTLVYMPELNTSDFSLQVIKKSTNELYKFLVK